jgi:hypothetical protein
VKKTASAASKRARMWEINRRIDILRLTIYIALNTEVSTAAITVPFRKRAVVFQVR